MDTTVYRVARLAYRLGRQDQQRILERRLCKHFDSEVQANQLRELAGGMTDEPVDFHAIVRAAEEGSTSPEAVNTAAPVNSGRPRSEDDLRERHTETCPRISIPGSECIVCEVFQHLARVRDSKRRFVAGIHAALGPYSEPDKNGLPTRSAASVVRRLVSCAESERETISEYETLINEFGYDFEQEADPVDWLRDRLQDRDARGDRVTRLKACLRDMLGRFAPTNDGLRDAEIACAERARAEVNGDVVKRTNRARCTFACPHEDQCTLERGHDGGHNHRGCDCNDPDTPPCDRCGERGPVETVAGNDGWLLYLCVECGGKP